MTKTLSVVLAVRNEEENIARCLNSVKDIADEIVVVDEHSTDKTRKIAEELGAKVVEEEHHDIFHITKQKALDLATGDWILQLDADEVVMPELAKEINDLVKHGKESRKPKELFLRHQKLIEERDGRVGKDNDEIVGYFIARKNMFLACFNILYLIILFFPFIYNCNLLDIAKIWPLQQSKIPVL